VSLQVSFASEVAARGVVTIDLVKTGDDLGQYRPHGYRREATAAERPSRSREEVIEMPSVSDCWRCSSYWSFVLLRPFISILVWSVMLAVALYRSLTGLSAHLGHRPRTQRRSPR